MRGEAGRVESRIDMVLKFWVQGDVRIHNLNVLFISLLYDLSPVLDLPIHISSMDPPPTHFRLFLVVW